MPYTSINTEFFWTTQLFSFLKNPPPIPPICKGRGVQTTVIHLPLFIKDLEIALKDLLKQKSNPFIVQNLSWHPLKASIW